MPTDSNDEVIEKLLAEIQKPSEESATPKAIKEKKGYDEYHEEPEIDKDDKDILEDEYFD